LSEVREYVARMKLSLEEADLTGFARDCHQIRVMLDSIIHSESGTVSVPRSLAERTEAMFRFVDPEGCIAQEWKDVIQR
jgi:hypothetical protein